MEGMETPPTKISFKEQMHQARERAILQAACDLLGAKSFDAMTMDDVANGVGIAKASLYKHFGSKEDLCCAAMVEVLHLARRELTFAMTRFLKDVPQFRLAPGAETEFHLGMIQPLALPLVW